MLEAGSLSVGFACASAIGMGDAETLGGNSGASPIRRTLQSRRGGPFGGVALAELHWTESRLEVLGASDFEGQRLRRPGRYVVTFGAEWCPWTRRFVPKFQAWSKEMNATAAIADITDMKSPLWDTFGIRITPTVVCFIDGSVVYRANGHRLIGVREREFRSVVGFMGKTTSPA